MSKDLFFDQRETEILAQMSEADYIQIPLEIRERMKLKSIDEPNWREVYEADKEWQEKHKAFIEALKAKKHREDEIRAENR
jgi:Ser/Thr protein kinase RdoA (MazF antagonist)